MPPKAAGAGKKKKRSGKRKSMRGRGLFGSLGGVLGGVAGGVLDTVMPFGFGKKRRGRGDLSNISPVTMGKPPGFIQA